jgi:hypothetical protein
MPWYKQSGAFQRRAAVNHQLRWTFARGGDDLALPKPVRSAILALEPPGSGEYRLKHLFPGDGTVNIQVKLIGNRAPANG